MATTEHTINDCLAASLRETKASWRREGVVRSEHTSILKGSAKKPDILIDDLLSAPVVIETEVAPAVSVEVEARQRLGEQLATSGKSIESAVAVRLPRYLRQASGFRLQELVNMAADLQFAVLSGSNESSTRWPPRGWLQGSVEDLSLVIQSASIPARLIDAATSWLIDGVTRAASTLTAMERTHPESVERIAATLKQERGIQTYRMAMTILADAFLFHGMLSGTGGELADLRSVEELRNHSNTINRADLLAEWRKILEVNYWPIFTIALQIMEKVPAEHTSSIINPLANTAERLLENRLTRSHDVMGSIFQKLIVDRKFLAAFYTMPASAELLARLAFGLRSNLSESLSDLQAVAALRVGDFACGTGTLLSTVYRVIRQTIELRGGDASSLHSTIMEETLVGFDIMPSAAHLTASMLAGVEPALKYHGGAVAVLPYGKQPDASMALGSFDLMRKQEAFPHLLATKARVMAGTATQTDQSIAVHDESFDLLIMNPPYARPTGHEGSKVGVPIPRFAAFGFSEADQREMAKATRKIFAGSSAHGNAGEASEFLVLADAKLKQSGVLALVMPISLMVGEAWERSRLLLERSYDDLILVTIAAGRTEDTSFSADTGSAECLVIARKGRSGARRATFVSLNQRPGSTVEGAEIARQIKRIINAGELRHLEDGPVGGSAVTIGDVVVGSAAEAPLGGDGRWRLSRVGDFSVAQTAFQLSEQSRLWLPGTAEGDAIHLPLAPVKALGVVGPYHMDISGNESAGGAVRGPFDIVPQAPHVVPTYPVLWSHQADNERRLVVVPDSEGVIRRGKSNRERAIIAERAERVWSTASHCHFNRDFRFNSQSLSFCYTERKTIGGRAWPSILLGSQEEEKALAVWGNSTPALLLYWWWSNKQHSGRGSITITVLPELPVLDLRNLDSDRLRALAGVFDELKNLPFLAVNEIEHDVARQTLDQRLFEVLRWDETLLRPNGPLSLLRAKLAAEPSIGGGKSR